VINVRQAMAAAWRRPVPDQLWDYLVEKGYVGEVEEDRMPVEDLLDQARQVLAAARPATSPADGNDVVRQAAGAAAAARIDALSAIYAAWARTDLEVLRFRSHPMFTSGLMESDEVGPWVLQQRAASAPGGNADQYLLEAFARSRPGAARPFVNLWYAADGQERIVAVDVKTVLGDLAKLADLLAGRYRWRPSGATMFVLTDSVPEVYVYSGSASVRGGATAATTTVTMALDPALTPDQVAGIYSRLKAKVQPSPPPRSLSVKHYRLAQHVGPHVTFLLEEPARITRPGRRARPDPDGLVRTVAPVGGCTWRSLRHDWNDQHGTPEGSDGKTWRYDADSNFIRDAKRALSQMLAPGWTWKGRASPSSLQASQTIRSAHYRARAQAADINDLTIRASRRRLVALCRPSAAGTTGGGSSDTEHSFTLGHDDISVPMREPAFCAAGGSPA